nr:lipopolysaccharide biosynthesis protein [Chloroflexota bacterium]
MHELSIRRGVITIGVGVFAERATAFISNILLARLLLPQDFGLVTMALTVSEAVTLLGNLGIGSALIHKRDETEEYTNAAFWLGLGVGVGLGVLQALISGWAAEFYRAPLVQPILLVYALGYCITALGNVHTTLLVKELRFDPVMKVAVSSALSNALVAVGLAAAGFGVWSLVLGRLAAQCVSTLMNWWLCRWRPSGWASKRHYSGLIIYGRNMFVSDGLAYLNHNADYLILGQQLGPAVLGIYLLAYNLAMLPVTTISLIVGRASFPVFAQLQHQREELQRTFVTAMRLSALLGFPILVGMVILANELIIALVGSRWQPAVMPLRLLAIYALGRSISAHAGQLLNAVGRPDIPMKFNLVYTPIFLPGLLVSARYGAVGVAAATAAISGVATWLYLLIALRAMDWSFHLVLNATGPPFVAANIMGFGVALGHRILSLYHPAPLAVLAVLVPAGVMLYALIFWMFYPEIYHQLEPRRLMCFVWTTVKESILH